MAKKKKLPLTRDKAVGHCPYCGKKKGFWYNDVPLKAYCWGKPSKEHRVWTKLVPKPFNPYL